MGYVIHLETYQGPFDLLLDLVNKDEIDIWDIPIASITEQYLAYLYSLQERDLAIAGEFLLMAATLIRIKSRLLLPQQPLEEEDPEEWADPREELVHQLLRYKFFKETALFLQEKRAEAVCFFSRGAPAGLETGPAVYTNPVGDVTLAELGQIYGQLWQELQKEPTVHAVSPRVSVQERLALIRLLLVGQPRLSFQELLQGQTAAEIVVTFLAVLELVRMEEIKIRQKKLFGEISIVPSARDLEANL